MIILPAIDLKDKTCVRLYKGDFSTAYKVADNAVATAQKFEQQGALWLHMVDLDGAKNGKPYNDDVIFDVKNNTNMHIEVGGGIRDMSTVDYYLDKGISRIILGSAALSNPEFVREAVKKHGKKIAVGIDAHGGKVAADGWTNTSSVDYIDLAKRMEDIGVKYIIFTDISTDGTLNGPNLNMLDKLNHSVDVNIIASGGVSTIKDILDLYELGVYGAIAGKSIYSGTLDLRSAINASQKISRSQGLGSDIDDELEMYFLKSDLIPAVVQESSTGEVLMLAYMNKESMKKTLETGYTWFYSRSRQELWNKGATSGNLQKVVSIHADCDNDTLLVKVVQTGNACHTGSHSCFFKKLI